MRFLYATMMVGVAVATLSCGDGTAPLGLDPMYVLVEQEGQPLPIVHYTTGDPEGDRTEQRILGRTLEIGPGDRVVMTRAEDELVITDADRDTVATVICVAETGTVRRSGSRVLLQWTGRVSQPVDTMQYDAGELLYYPPYNSELAPPLFRFVPGSAATFDCP